ncbi:hypothetical protein FD754_020679 [Muntiacus muntjak]|uniref:Uncharacterized protein n=1 Tax=Muntiacus muntjak TaxID=9888 RepID=A0A5N3V3M8_MUNMU|nr:hypothetical protein FD754_020679 [Muntiacus muntjak]
MSEKKPEPLDFVKDFQEYLTQQTHHVNMISGSVSGDKEAEALQGAGTDGMLVNGFERTFDGKLKCQYCNYASKGTVKGTWSSLSSKRMCRDLQKKISNLSYSRGALINLSPPSTVVQEPDYLNDFIHEIPNIQTDFYEKTPQELMVDNPLNQLSTLAGQLSSLPLENQNLSPPDVSSSPTSPEPQPSHSHRNYSPVGGPSSEPSAHTSSPSMGNSQPSTPAPTLLYKSRVNKFE